MKVICLFMMGSYERVLCCSWRAVDAVLRQILLFVSVEKYFMVVLHSNVQFCTLKKRVFLEYNKKQISFSLQLYLQM